MARFADDTIRHPPNPTVGVGMQFPPIPTVGIAQPPARLIPSGGGAQGQGDYGSNMTLSALMARQKELAEQEASIQQQPTGNIWGGMGMLANTLVNALAQRRARKAEEAGQAEVAQAFHGGFNDQGELAPEAMDVLMRREPELGLKLYEQAMQLKAQKAKQENWVDIPLPEGAKEGTQWQQNTVTGEKRAVGGAGVTVNAGTPLPAEVAGRIGMAQGFLDDYDNILKEVDAGNLTGTGYLSSVTFGRGSGGAAYRTIQSGVDALRRGLSGAGIGVQEAEDYVNRYAPAITDDAATLHSKLEGLKNDLTNVQEAVTQGHKIDIGSLGKKATTGPAASAPDATTAPAPGTTPAPGSTTPAPAATTPAPGGDIPTLDPKKGEDLDKYDTLPDGAQYRTPGDPTIHTKGAKAK